MCQSWTFHNEHTNHILINRNSKCHLDIITVGLPLLYHGSNGRVITVVLIRTWSSTRSPRYRDRNLPDDQYHPIDRTPEKGPHLVPTRKTSLSIEPCFLYEISLAGKDSFRDDSPMATMNVIIQLGRHGRSLDKLSNWREMTRSMGCDKQIYICLYILVHDIWDWLISESHPVSYPVFVSLWQCHCVLKSSPNFDRWTLSKWLSKGYTNSVKDTEASRRLFLAGCNR